MSAASKQVCLSVAMCTYNGERYVAEQLESIANQTMQPDELIICDDGSTDNTSEIIKQFRAMVAFPVSVYLNKSRLGVAKNFEKAIRGCQGKYIAFADQDDIWAKEKLERMAYVLDSSEDIGVVFCNAELIDDSGARLGCNLWEYLGVRSIVTNSTTFDSIKKLLLKKNVVTGACAMMRSELREHVMPIDRNWIHDYWIAVIALALGYKIVPVDEKLVEYRQHGSQVVGAKKKSVSELIFDGPKRWKYKLDEEVCRIRALVEYMEAVNGDGDMLSDIRDKNEFIISRNKINSRGAASRIIGVTRLLISGKYGRYTESHLDCLKDLLAAR